ncbi:MAG TPA: RdgB/HAM1 family non-canonical purine NTP pyrophosphatase [Beijerinckiaceae bacterium]|nr:RdgB/HAM1 family non-canonical purine NTP pyrophosphatase [Beijerinckiaceae bacterium]
MTGRRLAGRVVLATHNAGKLAEMVDLLAPFGVEVVSSGALGLPEPAETGTLFSENAAIKARAAAVATGLPAIADDSGLCVDLLDGAPGLFTADWAGSPRNFTRAMERLRFELERRGHDASGARAHFVSAIVVAWPDGGEQVFEGRVHGTLAFPPRGPEGFGYDPCFVPLGEIRTFGEMPMAEKKKHSHRARAIAAMTAACFR